MEHIFVTGIGTGIGKTVVSAILTGSLQANYWKPVQAGYDNITDSEWIQKNLLDKESFVHPEMYKLRLAASPHIAAREEGKKINIEAISNRAKEMKGNLIIEGPGGLLVPLNEQEFVIDLIKAIGAKVILVSRNYLGSINHSLMTAMICKAKKINVIGWIFNDQYLDYEDEIVEWSGFPKIFSIPHAEQINKSFLQAQAAKIKYSLTQYIC